MNGMVDATSTATIGPGRSGPRQHGGQASEGRTVWSRPVANVSFNLAPCLYRLSGSEPRHGGPGKPAVSPVHPFVHQAAAAAAAVDLTRSVRRCFFNRDGSPCLLQSPASRSVGRSADGRTDGRSSQTATEASLAKRKDLRTKPDVSFRTRPEHRKHVRSARPSDQTVDGGGVSGRKRCMDFYVRKSVQQAQQ